jgi:hypothetical protein
MKEWGKKKAMDLIRSILLFFGLVKLRQLVAENPLVSLDTPLLAAILVPVPARNGGRLSRGPTALRYRSGP